jgi:hypothetical protein
MESFLVCFSSFACCVGIHLKAPWFLIYLLCMGYILNSKYILLADDLKIYRGINKVHDCKRLQSDIGSVQNVWF